MRSGSPKPVLRAISWMAAPCASDASFAHTTSGSTPPEPTWMLKPQSAVYTHEQRPDLVKSGVRIRMWECTTSSNSYKDAEGNTQFYLPGDPQYKDPRGSTDFPDLPGQSLNPIFEGGAQ